MHYLQMALKDICDNIISIPYASQLCNDSDLYELDNVCENIAEWKKHLLKAVHQDNTENNIIKIQQDEQFLQLDWEMN